jgi:integrase
MTKLQEQNALGTSLKLTKRAIDAATPGTSRYILWDDELKGFGVRVELSGTKTYLIRYRSGGGRSAPLRQMVLGRHGVLTPEEARREARIQLARVAKGDDPAGERSTKRKELTIAQLVERYVAEHLEAHNKPTTRKECERIARAEIIPVFGSTRLSDLTRPMIHKWHSGFANRPYQGNRCLAVLRKMLSLAAHEWELRQDNPARGIKLFREFRRERFSTDDDLRVIGAWLNKVEVENSQPLGAIIATRLLALTGMRLGEVLGLQWQYIDLDDNVMRLPDTKVGARVMALGTSAAALLSALKGVGIRIGPVVCDFDGTALSRDRYRRFWAELRKHTGLKELRPHDFRHGAATFGAQAGANAFLLRDFMGHSTVAMTSEYVARVVDPLRQLADTISERVSSALGGEQRPKRA